MDAERDRRQDDGTGGAAPRHPAPAPSAEDPDAGGADAGSAAAAQPREGGDLTP